MANKQIKDYTNLPLADTDSLIKQSVAGATGKTTLADLKGNLDGRYQKPGVVVWEDEDGEISVDSLILDPTHVYNIVVSSMIGACERPGQVVTVVNPLGHLYAYAYYYVRQDFSNPPYAAVLTLGYGYPCTASDGRIYKIIDMGEML